MAIRRSSSCSSLGRMTKCRKPLVILLLFVGGAFFGFVVHTSGWTLLSSNLRSDSDHSADKTIYQKGIPKEGLTRREKGTTASEGVSQMSSLEPTRHQHEPPSKRPGISIKKDMSIQFREHIPQKFFINCGGTFPWDIELFLNTYPGSNDYKMVTFLEDTSYAVMYANFPNHTIHTPYMVSNINGSAPKDIKAFGSASALTQTVKRIDLAYWLKSNTFQDDFVILKMDSAEEKEIAQSLVDGGAIEYINKYYTTSSDQAVIDFVKDQFKRRNQDVLTWSGRALSYSDFEKRNPSIIPPGGGRVYKKCVTTTDKEQFALILYANASNTNIYNTVRLLSAISPSDKLPFSIFLPFSFWESGWKETWRIFRTFEIGLYFDVSGISASDTMVNQYNLIRYDMVATQKILDVRESILEYVMIGPGVTIETVNTTGNIRHNSFIYPGRNINHILPDILEGRAPGIDIIGRKPGEYLTIDISQPRAENLVMYMLQRFNPWIAPLYQCSVMS